MGDMQVKELSKKTITLSKFLPIEADGVTLMIEQSDNVWRVECADGIAFRGSKSMEDLRTCSVLFAFHNFFKVCIDFIKVFVQGLSGFLSACISLLSQGFHISQGLH